MTRFETQGDLSDEAPTRLYEESEAPRRAPNIVLLGFIILGLLSLVGFFGSRFVEVPDKGREVELKPVVSDKADPPTRSLQGKEATETAEPRAVQADTPPVATERVSTKTESGDPPAPSLATESKPKPKTKLKPKPKQRAKPQRRGEQPAATSNTSKRSQLGTLQLRVEEGWYNVMLGNRRLGTTPLGGVSLPVGQHLLVLDNPVTGERREVQVKISAGDALSIGRGELMRLVVQRVMRPESFGCVLTRIKPVLRFCGVGRVTTRRRPAARSRPLISTFSLYEKMN